MVHRELSVGFSHIFEFSWSSCHSLAFQSVSKCFRSEDLGRCLQSCWNIHAFLLLLFYFIVFFLCVVWYEQILGNKISNTHQLHNCPQIKKDVFSSCHERGTKKNSEPPWGIEPQTFGFALRCSTTKPQRLFGEWGLLRSSNDTHPAYC